MQFRQGEFFFCLVDYLAEFERNCMNKYLRGTREDDEITLIKKKFLADLEKNFVDKYFQKKQNE
jgi:hypothetical protein